MKIPRELRQTRAGETPALHSATDPDWHDRGYLPHLRAEGGTYFVTFRLADTLPQEVLADYQYERETILKRARVTARELSPEEEKRLTELHSERIESYLDAGHGRCLLKIPEVGSIVAGTLRHFEGSRYDLHAWVVMPNHVHVVVTPRQDRTLSSILHSWKSFTAHEAQKVAQVVATASRLHSQEGESVREAPNVAQASRLHIARGEPFWQRESYDRLVRDEVELVRVCEYTILNPVKAGLCERLEDWKFSSAFIAHRCG